MLSPLDLASLAPELAAALRQAQAARDGLAPSDALRAPMDKLLQHVELAVQCGDHGKRPTLPDRGRFLNKLSPSNASRPLRAAAFDAMVELIACGWPSMNTAERKRKSRMPASLAKARAEAAKAAEWKARWQSLGCDAAIARAEQLDKRLNDALTMHRPLRSDGTDAPALDQFFNDILEPVLDELATLVDPGPYACGDVDESLGYKILDVDDKLSMHLQGFSGRITADLTLVDVLRNRYPAIVAWLKRIPNLGCRCAAPMQRQNAFHYNNCWRSSFCGSFCALLGPFNVDWGHCRDGCSCPRCMYPWDKWDCGGYYDRHGDWIVGLDCPNCRPSCGLSREEIKRDNERCREQEREWRAQTTTTTRCRCYSCSYGYRGPA